MIFMFESIRLPIEQIKLGLVLLLVLLFSACTLNLQPSLVENTKQKWDARTNFLYQKQNWTAQIALIGNNQQEKFKTRVVWEQQSDTYQIKLHDFIGRTIAVIDGTPSGVIAKTSKGERYQGDDAEALIDELFAINIPVSGMRYWLQGVPIPNETIDQILLDDSGLTKSLSQQGWEITYPHYLQNEPYKMPSQVILEFENIKLTVKITQWTLQ